MVPMKREKIGPVLNGNIDGKHQLPPHPSSKPPSSLNPNAVIGGPGISTSAASGNANGGSLQSQLNVPSSAHSKHSAANQQQTRPVPM